MNQVRTLFGQVVQKKCAPAVNVTGRCPGGEFKFSLRPPLNQKYFSTFWYFNSCLCKLIRRYLCLFGPPIMFIIAILASASEIVFHSHNLFPFTSHQPPRSLFTRGPSLLLLCDRLLSARPHGFLFSTFFIEPSCVKRRGGLFPPKVLVCNVPSSWKIVILFRGDCCFSSCSCDGSTLPTLTRPDVWSCYIFELYVSLSDNTWGEERVSSASDK